MGSTMSRSVVGCFTPAAHANQHPANSQQVLLSEPLDEGLGHSFCYIRPSSASAAHTSSSPPHSDTDILSNDSFSGNLQQRNASDPAFKTLSETSFKTISGASVSANTSTPRTITSREQFANVSDDSRAAAFEGTASFNSLPLQPVPRGLSQSGPISSGSQAGYGPLDRGYLSGPIERGFMSGPIERGFLSGPLERGCVSAPMEPSDRGLFSAPLNAGAYFRRRKRSLAQLVRNIGQPVKKAISRSLSRSTVSFLTAPVKQLLSGKDDSAKEARAGLDCNSDSGYSSGSSDDSHNLQWAQGKAGEDRVHIVLSEEHEWLFVGIYDGFNGPDAPDFLLSNLYNEVYKQLRGLLWDRNPTNSVKEPDNSQARECCPDDSLCSESQHDEDHVQCSYHDSWSGTRSPSSKSLCKTFSDKSGKVTGSDQQELTTTTGESHGDCKRNSSCSHEKSMNTVKSSRSVKSLFEFKLRKTHGDSKEENSKSRVQSLQLEQEAGGRVKNNVLKPTLAVDKACKSGAIDHSAVLKALAVALESTENAYLEMANLSMEEMPELALMGSCVLVMLMKGEDVYVMNVGDSRAILATAKTDPKTCTSSTRGLASLQAYDSERIGARDSQLRQELERIMEEISADSETFESSHTCSSSGPPPTSMLLNTLQLSTDHSTNVEEEVLRIRMEHPDDNQSISNDRVKGRLKVTRAFGAGFLKMPRWNNALLEMFRVEYVGSSPYLSCIPALHHHSLGPNDRFLVLSSDGLYQYLSNEEVVSQVEWFMENYPDGDPAQYLIEELLFRAAKKAGMDFHELLDIPQGDRRKYHDDVSVMVISFEGRIWRSFG